MSPARIGLTVAHGVCTTAAIHLASPAGTLAVAAVVTLALAGLAWALRAHDAGASTDTVSWPQLRPLIADFWQLVSARVSRKHRAGRLKQWLNFLRRRYPEAEAAYAVLRTVNDPTLIDAWASERGAIVNDEPLATDSKQIALID